VEVEEPCASEGLVCGSDPIDILVLAGDAPRELPMLDSREEVDWPSPSLGEIITPQWEVESLLREQGWQVESRVMHHLERVAALESRQLFIPDRR
jgi:hypothetical protein